MECSEALDLLYASFDGQVNPTEQNLLDGHRRTCFACANSMVKAERFQELLRHVPQLTVPRGLEYRIINHVASHARGGSTAGAKVRSITSAARHNWRGITMAASALAAAFAALVMTRGAIFDFVHHRPADETITAQVQGNLEYQGADSRVASVSNGSAPITSGDAIQNISSVPATVGITPHLAVTVGPLARVHFSKVHVNLQTSIPDVIDMHLDRGSVTVHEVLHRDASPIHVATNEATLIPTGTVFQVSQQPNVTLLGVTQGSVAVYMPGHVYSLRAGQKGRVSGTSFTRSSGGRVAPRARSKDVKPRH